MQFHFSSGAGATADITCPPQSLKATAHSLESFAGDPGAGIESTPVIRYGNNQAAFTDLNFQTHFRPAGMTDNIIECFFEGKKQAVAALWIQRYPGSSPGFAGGRPNPPDSKNAGQTAYNSWPMRRLNHSGD